MKYAIDVSNYQSNVDATILRSVMYSERIERIIIGMQDATIFNAWYDAAELLGIRIIDGYTFDVTSSIALAQTRPLNTLWLDEENAQQAIASDVPSLQAAIDQCRQSGSIEEAGIYTSLGYWQFAGNPQMGNYCPLWLASYNGLPSTFDVNFGGWLRASMIQYEPDVSSYGLQYDRSVYE